MTASGARAVVWDMDGIIVDTAPYHFKAWQEAFQKIGVNFTEEDFRRGFGQRNDTIIRSVLGESISGEELEVLSSKKEKSFRQGIRQKLTPLPGAIELIKQLGKHGFKLGLVSSAPEENIRLLLDGLDISSYFRVTISGDDIDEGKPSPQGFLMAARKLEVEPAKCVVIEDAVAGVTAAKRAGMHCLAVTNTHPKASLAQADLIVATLEAVSVSDLEGLLSRS